MLKKRAIYEVPIQPCFLSRSFQVPKGDGSFRLVVDLTELNKDRLAELCNDQPARPKASFRSTMLDGINRHQRCFLAHSNQKISSQIPSNIVESKTLLLPNSTLWTDNFPQDFHLHHEASSSPFTLGRDKRAHLSRQPHYREKLSGTSPPVDCKDHKDPTGLGLPSELGKVNARSDKVPNRLGIVWNSLKETMTILLLYVNEIK